MTTTTLLISTDPSLIVEVQRLHDMLEQWRLEVYGRIEKGCAAAMRDEVGLVLIHLAAVHDYREVQHLLSALSKICHATTAFVSGDPDEEVQADTLASLGASGYIVLRPDPHQLARLLDIAAQHRQNRVSGPTGPDPTAGGQDPLFFAAFPDSGEQIRQIQQVMTQDTTVLLTGETGTGKTLLARRIHELSPRRNEPFLVVDCGSLSASLIESEMFGHVRGAFTGADRDRAGKFAAAGCGTLVLDEINSLHPSLQGKLLRAVEDRVFEPVGSNKPQPLQARLIAVTNTPLDQEVSQGRFRADLYYRLNVVEFDLPPLRQRRSAIPHLASAFLAEFSGRSGRTVSDITGHAQAALQRYDWPGNIRELRNAIERAVALCAGPIVQFSDLPKAVISYSDSSGHAFPYAEPSRHSPFGPEAGAAQTELQRIAAALQKHRNNRKRAAAELGISRVTLYKKMDKYGLKNGE